MSDELEALRNGPFKKIDQHTHVTYELLAQDSKTFHTHRNHYVPYHLKGPILSSHFQ